VLFFFSSRRRHTRFSRDWSSDVCSSDLTEDSYRKVIRLNLLQEKALTDGVDVTDEEIQAQYERQGTELNARHILVADEETANKRSEERRVGKEGSGQGVTAHNGRRSE